MRGFRLANPNTKTERQRIGGDVYLTPPDSAGGPRVDVGFAVPDWKPATAGKLNQAAFPGTAVLLGSRWYEIHRVAPLIDAPHRTAYHLRPWNDSHVIRTAFELTPEACETLTRNHRERLQRQAKGATLRTVPFLTGMLPGADQKRLETELGVPAVRATMISTMLLLALSITVLMLKFALSMGLPLGDSLELVRKITTFWLLAWYLAIESIVRMQSAKGNEPMGTLPVALPAHVFHALRRLNVPREQIDARRATRPPPGGMFTARDQVRPLDHPEYDLEVISQLPKDHWTANVTGIEYQGEAYVLLERKLIETEDGPRHHFLLQKPRHEVLFRSYVHFYPEEVRDIYRSQQRAKTSTWVETFALLWGLTSGATQERLGWQYNYDPHRWTRNSINGTVVLGTLFVIRGVGQMLAGVAGGSEVLVLVAGVYLLWESALRRSKLRAGKVGGSLLGVVFEPLAKRCLRWE